MVAAMPVPPRALFAGLVDDAALFPPGNAPMARGVAEHATHRAAPYGDLVGPFLCPASRVDELVAAQPAGPQIRLALIYDVTDDAAWHARKIALSSGRTRLAWTEATYGRFGDDVAAVRGGQVRDQGPKAFLEVPRTGFETALDLVGSPGWHAAKYRTGGTSAEAFPSEAEVADFLLAATERGVPFKLTAGLHHAVRHTGEGTGFEHHGVLNLLVATKAAQDGAGGEKVAVVLAERAADPLVDAVTSWDEDTCVRVRNAFRSFGCCGVTDPIDDLTALGLLGDAA